MDKRFHIDIMQYLSGEQHMGFFDITFPPLSNHRFTNLNSPYMTTITSVTGHLGGVPEASSTNGHLKHIPLEMIDITFTTTLTSMKSSPVKGMCHISESHHTVAENLY
jgi:hypothetical protein